MKNLNYRMNRFGDGPAPFKARNRINIRGLLLTALLCGLVSVQAELTFHQVDTTGINARARFGGTSLNGLFMTASEGSTGSADVFQYNAANRSWDVFSSYATHRDNSSLSGNAQQIAVSGDYIYVSRLTNPGTLSIYNGTSWSTLDLSHPFSNPLTRRLDGIYAQGGQAVITRENGYINIVDNGVDTITSNHPRPLGNVSFIDNNGIVGVGDTVFVKGTNNQISRSTDLGETWSAPVTISGSTSSFGSLFALDANKVFSSGYGDAIWRSTDGGTNWTEITVTGFGTTRAVYAADENTLFVGGAGGLFFSDDAGATWSSLNSQLTGYTNQDIRGIHAVEDHIFFSADNGDMWVAIPEPGTLMLMGLGFATLWLTKAFRK